MKKIKVCYTIRDNLGDSINPLIFAGLFHCDTIRTDEFGCEVSGIGSGLRRFFIEPNSRRAKLKLLKGKFCCKKLYLFSAGFSKTPTGNEKPLRRNMHVLSVRGELSKQHISGILNRKIECSTGDAGLLASELLKEEIIDKKYDVGIIPHDKERDEQFYHSLKDKLPNSTIIDVRGDVITRLREIASCKTVISSSLHGLIIADSFHIPNLHVKLTDKLSGDGFKFKDYYSCFGLDDECVDLNTDADVVSKDYIEANYRIKTEAVEAKKNEIKDAFNKFLGVIRVK